MIYTVTLNPALDRTLHVERFEPGGSNRIVREARYAGGKGIDVSRALLEMGTANVALGFVGGFDGKEFEGRLLLDGVTCSFTRIAGETRTNVIIQEDAGDSETALLARGPEVRPDEVMDFITRLESLPDIAILVVSGSLPPGLTPEVYRRIIGVGRDKGALVVLDTAGEALRQSLSARPAVIKPNRHELAELAGADLPDIESAVRFCRTLHDRVETVLVSLGPDGIVLVAPDRAVHARPPAVKVRSTVGAGDCAVAGYVCGIAAGDTPDAALRRAVAAGTAATLNPGTGLCCRADIESLMPQVAVAELRL